MNILFFSHKDTNNGCFVRKFSNWVSFFSSNMSAILISRQRKKNLNVFSRSVKYFFTILNILWEDASDCCKTTGSSLYWFTACRYQTGVSLLRPWNNQSNVVSNVDTRVGVGRRYHGDMTAPCTTLGYWLCCFNRKLGHCAPCQGFHMGGLLTSHGGQGRRPGIPCIHTPTPLYE